MYLTRSTARILEFFVGHITESFTLREVARRLKMHVSLTHRAIQPLLASQIVEQDKHKNLRLNYKKHHETLIFAEYLRRDKFLEKNKDIALFSDEVLRKIREDSFVLLIFGSAVESSEPRDIDVLLIVNNVEFHEKFLDGVISNYDLPFEERVISIESMREMLLQDEKNIINELLNKHIILYGAELFYRLLQKR